LDFNPVTGVKVRAGDPRATKPSRVPKVWTFAQMHHLASHAGKHEAMCRVLSDCGLRLGELLALHRADLCAGCDECKGAHLHVQRNAHEGVVTAGDAATKKHVKIVPVPDSTLALLKAMPPRIDSPLLFPTATGCVWRESNFYRTVWYPARKAQGCPTHGHTTSATRS
jgi:integrase